MRPSIAALLLIPTLAPLQAARDSLFDHSLEELLAIEVVVISDRLEKEFTSFASVDRLGKQELDNLASSRVFEGLDHLAGIDTHLSIGGTTTVSIRGYTGSTTSARGKALLFDGIPLNGFAFGSALYSKSVLPANLLESIEVVKGPISSFHGPDAFHGAILMRPWTADTDQSHYRISLGSRDDYEANFRSRYQLGGRLTGTTNVNYYRQNDAEQDAPNVGREFRNRYESATLNQQFQYNTHKFGLLYNRSTAEDFYGVFSQAVHSTADPVASLLAYYKSDIELSNTVTFKPTVWYNESEVDLYFNSPQRLEGWRDRQFGIKAHADIELEASLLRFGFEFIDSKVQESISHLVSAPKANGRYHGFSKQVLTGVAHYQTDLVPDKIRIDLGLRFDHFSNTKSKELSPKIGLIGFLNTSNVIKAIYANGYRAPAAGELAGTTSFLGNERLAGETLDSYELIHIFQGESLTITNTVFKNKWQDGIITAPTPAATDAGKTAEFINHGKSESYGYESEIAYLHEPWNTLFFLNGSIVKSQDLMTGKRFQMFPETKLAYGLRYAAERWSASLANLHKLDRRSSGIANAPMLPDFFETNLTLRYKLDGWSISLAAENLFDQGNIEPSIWNAPGGIYNRDRYVRLGFDGSY